ncbi:MAG: FHA domain-containing protein [Planctomycetota bacterium]
MAFLIIESGPDQGRKVDLGGPLIIGRQARIGLSIKDTKASREHARIEPAAGSYVVVDLQSSNGTLLNGRKVEREFLQAGDRVTIGATVFRFEDADANPASSTRPMKEPIGSTPVSNPRAPGGSFHQDPVTPATSRPAPAQIPAALPVAAAAEPAIVDRNAPRLRYQDQARGPGFLAIVVCTAILVGLVFASRWIGQRAIAKAILERKQGQQSP